MMCYLHEKSKVEICKVKQFVDQKFTIKDFQYANFFLGLEITRSVDAIDMNQTKICSLLDSRC